MANDFRATMWFKKGELDAELAQVAVGHDDGLHPGAADLLPVEDRYLDDGSITAEDRDRFSLRIGGTQAVPTIPEPAAVAPGDVGGLVRDLKRGRTAALAAVGAVTVAAAAIAVYLI